MRSLPDPACPCGECGLERQAQPPWGRQGRRGTAVLVRRQVSGRSLKEAQRWKSEGPRGRHGATKEEAMVRQKKPEGGGGFMGLIESTVGQPPTVGE